MRKFDKKTMSAAVIAAAIAALTLAGCGKSLEDVQPKNTTNGSSTTQPALTLPPIETTPTDTSDAVVTEIPVIDENGGDEDAAEKNKKTTTKPAETTTTATTTTAATTTTTTTTTKAVTPQKYTPVVVANDPYAGNYSEKFRGVGAMTVANIGNNQYSIHIEWAVNDSEFNSWDLVGTFDANKNMNYTSCIKNNHIKNANGTETLTTIYTNGTGSIKLEDGYFNWNDNMGDILPDTFFVTKQTNTTTTTVTTTTTTTISSVPAVTNDPSLTPMGTFSTGSFYDGNGSRATLNITKSSNNSYTCTVSTPYNAASHYEYHFIATQDNDTIVYSDCTVNLVEYNDDGTVKSNSVVGQGHYGSVISSNTGLVWYDSDGSNYVFIG